jgi:hypothetical protein
MHALILTPSLSLSLFGRFTVMAAAAPVQAVERRVAQGGAGHDPGHVGRRRQARPRHRHQGNDNNGRCSAIWSFRPYL